jgi:hypothetical protein
MLGVYMRKQVQRLKEDVVKKIMSLQASHINFKDEFKTNCQKRAKARYIG